jgi:hypothetical protein
MAGYIGSNMNGLASDHNFSISRKKIYIEFDKGKKILAATDVSFMYHFHSI